MTNTLLFSDALWLLGGLCLSAFTSATLLPGTSEAAFVALLTHQPELALVAWLVAGCGNSLGSFTSYAIGCRLLSHDTPRQPRFATAINRLQRFGAPLLFFSWLPIIGDALPLAAGSLHLPKLPSLIFIALGKFARYGVLWWIAQAETFAKLYDAV